MAPCWFRLCMSVLTLFLSATCGMHMPTTQEPFFIGVTGGTASGKTSVVDKVVKALGHESVVSITMDCFYRDLTDAERERANACDFDFDHPNAVSTAAIRTQASAARITLCHRLIPPRPSVSSTSTICSK